MRLALATSQPDHQKQESSSTLYYEVEVTSGCNSRGQHSVWPPTFFYMKKIKEKYSKPSSIYSFPMPDYKSHTRTNDIPTSDKIAYVTPRKTIPKLVLPEGKAVSIAYNKGGYQLVDKDDLKGV